jgi:hypothetical protein
VHRRDHSLLLTVVADRSPRLFESARQRRLTDEAIAPHGVEQFGLGDEPVAVGDQVNEHVEHLRLDVDDLAAAPEHELVEVQLAVLESVHGGSHGIDGLGHTNKAAVMMPDERWWAHETAARGSLTRTS